MSNTLFDEFDSNSLNYWPLTNSSLELIEGINDQIRNKKHECLSGQIKPDSIGIPEVKNAQHLHNLADKYESDPFIPASIRAQVVSCLRGRYEAQHIAHVYASQFYMEGLCQGKYWDNLKDNHGWFHNKINQSMYEQGYGISQTQEKVNELRLAIQKYFENFNPIR